MSSTDVVNPSGAGQKIAFIFVLIFAVGLRIVAWPHFHELRDGDELAYAGGSLQMLEGNLPGIHYAPAGPQTWIGWLYAAGVSLGHLARPDSVERSLPLEVRPYAAVTHTLFDAYRDMGLLRQIWVLASVAASIGGVAAAFRLGWARAGTAGALFLGGTFASLPLFVEFSVQARPYIVGWSLGIISLYFLFEKKREYGWWISAISMGLAAASRVDMLLLLPLAWSELWIRRSERDWFRRICSYHIIVALSFIVAAPWYLMTIIPSLRAVATVRGAGGLIVASPIAVFLNLLLEQGMGFHVALFLLSLILLAFRKPRQLLLVTYLILIAWSVFKGAAFGLRYQGAPVILGLVVALIGLKSLSRISSVAAIAVSLIAFLWPTFEAAKLVLKIRRNYVPDYATEWVEAHVPPGTTVYTRPWITNILPTVEASNAGWEELTDIKAYQRKFESGMKRFGLGSISVPRGLSEANLALERGNRRFMFILGDRQWIDAPRFDVRIIESGPAFGIRDVAQHFKDTGGVVILRGPAEDPLAESLGTPTVAWVSMSGSGTRLYCSPDLVGKLR